MQRFWRLLQPDIREVRNVYVYAIFSGLMSLSLPLGIQAILNLIQGGQVSTSWIVLLVVVLLGVAASGILQIYQLRITENLQQKIFTRASLEFAYRIPRIKMQELYSRYAPELMNRFFDIMSVQKGLSKVLIEFSTATLHIFFGLLLLSLYHPFFILLSIAMVIIVYLIFRWTAARGLRTSLKESNYKYVVAHWLEEVARTVTTFKLAGNTDLPLTKADKHVNDYLRAREDHFSVLVKQYGMLVVFKVLVVAALLAIGGVLVINQHMNIGQFVAAEIIIILVIGSVEKLILSLETIYDVLTALEKIGQVTDLQLENTNGMDVGPSCSAQGLAVKLEGVEFAFPEGKDNVINNLTLSVEAGARLLVTGENGSGKSTLLHLLGALYIPQKGALSFNDLPVGSLDPDSLRAVIGDYFGHELLFEGTVLQNITMGRENATFENVQWAVQNLGLESFIRSLPDGYETVIDPRGNRLPGSIVQKLLLARAVADKPKLLLIEDAFAKVHPDEKEDIVKFMLGADKPWTVVVISSDPFVQSQCTERIYMKDGAIFSQGSPDSSSKH